MTVTEEVAELFDRSAELAEQRHYEYLTPELLLLCACDNVRFADAFENCGGDTVLLASALERYLSDNMETDSASPAEMSAGMQDLVNGAISQSASSGRAIIELSHLLHALWQLPNSYAVYYMAFQGVTEADLLESLADTSNEPIGTEASEAERDSEDASLLSRYAPCLNETLGDVNPLIGREAELERTIQILCRRDKNNPLHIGEAGVGKTALTYGLVCLLQQNLVPDVLLGAKVYALDLGGVLAGTQYRGEFEKRLKKVLSAIEKEDKPIIYIDEIHNLLGAGATGEGSFDAANILKPYLSGGKIRFIGATTFDEYKKHFEKSKSLTRRFQNVEISEPSVEETVRILDGLREKYEDFHGVRYAPDVMRHAAEMSAKYIHERFLPDKAIDLIDEAGAYRRIHPCEGPEQTVDSALIDEILTGTCRIPRQTVETDEAASLATLESRMLSQIFGQDSAVRQVVSAVKYSRAGLKDENKPLASLLFVGPTGVGKTEIARVLAQELGYKLIRFDMSEYGERHAIAKLIGSPAGYVGYEEGGLLTEAIRKSPTAVLLLDEIEKAHPDIFSTLLQVMDYATLTDNQGRKADFRNTILIMTSNAGASGLEKTGIGFAASDLPADTVLKEVKRVFQPEFRNRLTGIITFNRIDEAMANRIAEKKLRELSEKLAGKGILFEAEPDAVSLLVQKGTSREYGAREIVRIIENEVKPLLVDEILFGRLKEGGYCRLMTDHGRFLAKITPKADAEV